MPSLAGGLNIPEYPGDYFHYAFVKILMAAYASAEQGKTLDFPPPGLEAFVPAVAKGTWRP